ncbi:thioredoxin domain-containing protein [Luteococcus sp. H138]|uniref:DsbA family protein n=1 Tax=unclassified Luteococcus TaxID=2639923 RepID=UPI00313AF0B3
MSSKKASGSSPAPANRREQLRIRQEAEARKARQMRIVMMGALVLALAIAAIVGTVLFNNNRTKAREVTAQGTPPNATADKSAIVVNPGKAKQGAPTVSLFFDYQCPACKQLEQSHGPLLESLANKGEINFEYRTMTFMERNPNLLNSASTRAAIGAACADKAGAYAKYHNAVFANQAQQEVKGSEGYSDELLRSTIPQQVGITGEQLTTFQSCYDTRATEDFVKTVDEKASAAGITGTPSLMVNGNKVDMKTVNLGSTEAELLAALKANA